MAEPNHSPRKGGNPVTAFFRGLYTEMAFSKESLRLNGQGLLFGLGVGLLVGVLGGLTSCWPGRTCCATARPGPASFSLWRGWWWCGCTAGAASKPPGGPT